jgi:hypothetical protein
MLRTLLVLLGIGVSAAAAADTPRPLVVPDASKIYPYLVPRTYLAHQPRRPAGLTRKLGHGIYVVLVHDLDGMVRNVSGGDLAALKLSPGEAHARALENLARLADEGAIAMRHYRSGPDGQPFILFGGHWAAAAAILLPRLRELAVRTLETDAVCASIPHRDAMLIFPTGTRSSRAAFIELIREQESDGAKPLTFGLFELTPTGVVELRE